MPYLTGDPSTAYRLRLIRIPSDKSFLIAVDGALLELAREYNWETFGTQSAAQAAEAAFEMWDEYMASSLVGQIFPHVLATLPPGALPCDGRIIARADYPRLYDMIADEFKSGPDHIALPDLRGRFIYGNNPALGGPGFLGGSETVTLETAHMPAHNHATLPHSHSTTIPISALINGGIEAPAAAAIPGPGLTAAADVETLNAGGGQPHNNMPPYITLSYAMWVE